MFKSSNRGVESLKLQSCPGISGYYLGQNILFLDNCITKDIIWFLLEGAAYYSIMGLLASTFVMPAGITVGVAGILVGLGAGYLSLYNRGYGYSVFVTRTPMELYPQ
ncbi:hypothetical protein [Virgibacillus sp. L01]|uniref:hypothetical protein n=1 Tax=Virgibacillus sp. L01 TaxID=3457429 RepID=UPI003FD241CF